MLTSQERDRLCKLLGMLGSEFDGERATAGAMISKMAKNKKMTIADMCLSPVSYTKTDTRRDEQEKYREPPKPKKNKEEKIDHSEFIRAARFIFDNYMHVISEWEQGFVESMKYKKLDWLLSPKQLPIMERIIKKVTEAVENGATAQKFEEEIDVPF